MILKRDRRAESSILFSQLKFLKLPDIFKLTTSLFVYKSLNNLIDSPIIYVPRVINAYNLRNRPQLQVPNHISQQSERFLHIRGAKVWNDIPENGQVSRTTNSFKRKFKKILIDAYN